MALGNVIGSNIFNILFVLGICSIHQSGAFLLENIIDIIILVIMSLIVMAFAWTSQTIKRNEGIIMLVLYAVYLVYHLYTNNNTLLIHRYLSIYSFN